MKRCQQSQEECSSGEEDKDVGCSIGEQDEKQREQNVGENEAGQLLVRAVGVTFKIWCILAMCTHVLVQCSVCGC